MGGCDSAEVRRPAIRSTAHDPIGACDIGWIGAMGLIHGGTSWGHATLAGSGR